MDVLSRDILNLLIFILPGLFGAAIYSLLYAPPQRAPLERVIQALLYTFIIRGLVGCIKFICIKIGENYFILGEWDSIVDKVVLIICTIFIAILFSKIMQTDRAFWVLRKLKLTNRTPFPSEWYGVFNENTNYIMLHMNDGRFMFGDPIQWPNKPDEGHFLMIDAEWITRDKKINKKGPKIKSILIPAREVKFVEFIDDVRGFIV